MSAGEPPVAVFLGPSLSLEAASPLLEAVYLPPAQFGDVYRLIGGGMRAIVLVDGVFHGRAPVWQRELLYAMESGIRVYGASSMGALRAAELHPHGMVGIGTVYEWYVTGEIDGDDEVALLHAGAEQRYRPLTEPLVNLRFNLREAATRGLVERDEAAAMTAELAAMPFWERTTSVLWDAPACRALDPPRLARLRAFFGRDAIDVKRRDAALALAEVARRERDPAPAATPTVVATIPGASHHDRFRLLERAFHRPGGEPIRGRALADRVLADPARRRLVRWSLAARFFARQWALDHDDVVSATTLAVLEDDALLSTLPDLEMEELRPVASRAAIARALPHVAAWCERSGAAPSPEVNAILTERFRGAIEHLTAQDQPSACDPFLRAVWAIERGPAYFGYATWTLAAELLGELQVTGALASLLGRWDQEDA
jgi:hypothetical protein